ncbi:Mercury transporter (plasmid) [Beijerinckiaceae bacterium RH AL1]|jgi:periplasmic mercuric ion binding protein|nr:mercury transporter [Beijerinckiaceae bacterium]VVB50360.1 Mercury transporter [Beijerinckiaceae bacterium RH CH11]VVB50369.1 Mercury transporter [Beijerinckiaceae bacterium RH AL8]VVC57369.1 Mercury transporter [Beijerinckiaceae bacterium RH AL1]
MLLRHLAAVATFATLLSPGSLLAAEKTVVLNVDKANCKLCAPIVKRTLSRVEGVKTIQIVEARVASPAVAKVMFDDAATNVAALITATTNAGYPSHLAN